MSELELWNELGNIYYKTGAVDEAIRTYQKAIELDPVCGEPYSNLASIFVRQGRYREAIPLFQKGIALMDETTNRAFQWNQLANTYRKLADYANARSAYMKAIELDPKDSTFRKNLAEVELVSRKIASAGSGITNKSSPEIEGTHKSEIGNACWMDEKKKPALQDEGNSPDASEPPTEVLSNCNLSNAMDESNKASTPDSEDAHSLDLKEETMPIDPPERMESIDADAHNLLRLGILHWRKGEFERAIQFLKTSLDSGGRSQNQFQKAISFYLIAQVETDLGRIEEAIQAYHSAAILAPGRISPWNKLGDLNCMLNRFEDARTAFQEAIEHNPKDPISWNGLGDVYHKLGRYEEAISAYQLGNVFENQGREEDVLEEFEKSIDSDQENPCVWNKTGNIYCSTGAYGDGIAAYHKAIELDPDNVTYQASLAKAEQALEEANASNEQLTPGPLTEINPEALPQSETLVAEKTSQETEATNKVQKDSTGTGQSQEAETVPEQVSIPVIGVADPEPEAAYWVFKSVTQHGYARQPVKTPLPAVAGKVLSTAKPIPAFGNKKILDQDFSCDRNLTDSVREDARILVQLTPHPVMPAKTVETSNLPVEKHEEENVSSEPEAGLRKTVPEREIRNGDSSPDRNAEENSPAENPERDLQVLDNDISAYRRVIEINPENDRAWDTLGNVYENAGVHGEAAAAFEQAAALRPEKEVYHYHLGIALGYQKQYEKAIQSLEKVVALNPRYMLAHCALAGYYRRIGNEAEAQEHAQIARPSMQEENEYNQACFESISGDADRAIALLEIALEKQQIQPAMVRSDPDLDFIRNDARFEPLLIKNKIIIQ